MDQNILLKAQELANREYTVNIKQDHLSDGSQIFSAENPELFGCIAQGRTPIEAIDNLFDARVDYIYDSIIHSEPIPKPNFIPDSLLHTEYIQIDLTPLFSMPHDETEDLVVDVSKVGKRVEKDPSPDLTVLNSDVFVNA